MLIFDVRVSICVVTQIQKCHPQDPAWFSDAQPTVDCTFQLLVAFCYNEFELKLHHNSGDSKIRINYLN